MVFLGIDLGTTGVKSMLFDKKGEILGSDYIEYGLIMTEHGIEQDANLWWENVKKSVVNTMLQSGVRKKDVAALAVSSQGIAFVPVDRAGQPLMNAISWLDGRSTAQIARIRESLSETEVFCRTGKRLLPYVLPQLMWVKENLPDVYGRTWKILMAHDYIVYKLTGKAVTDLSMASGTLLLDIHAQRFLYEYARKFGIDTGILPALGVLGDKVGGVLPEIADELGLSPETLVVLGAQDQRCASIGAGIGSGIFTVSLGTASAICAVTEKPLIDPERKVTCCGLDRRRWMLETVVATAGKAFGWLKDCFFSGKSFDELTAMAAAAEPGAGGAMFFPHLFEGANGRACGAFEGLSLHTQDRDIVRAVLEGVAFQIKLHIGEMERIGAHGQEIRIFGGGAKSELWCRIIADITGKKAVLPRTHETANLGAAIIAGVGAGVFEDYEDASSMLGDPARTFYPDTANALLYHSMFQSYQNRNAEILNN